MFILNCVTQDNNHLNKSIYIHLFIRYCNTFQYFLYDRYILLIKGMSRSRQFRHNSAVNSDHYHVQPGSTQEWGKAVFGSPVEEGSVHARTEKQSPRPTAQGYKTTKSPVLYEGQKNQGRGYLDCLTTSFLYLKIISEYSPPIKQPKEQPHSEAHLSHTKRRSTKNRKKMNSSAQCCLQRPGVEPLPFKNRAFADGLRHYVNVPGDPHPPYTS